MPDPYRELVPPPAATASEAEVKQYHELLVTLRRRDAKLAFDRPEAQRYLAWLRHRFYGESSSLVVGPDGRLDLELSATRAAQRDVVLTIDQDLRAVERVKETPMPPTVQVTEGA